MPFIPEKPAGSVLLSAEMERLPEEAKGKTSKRTSHGHRKYGGMYTGTVSLDKMTGKSQERTFRSFKLPIMVETYTNTGKFMPVYKTVVPYTPTEQGTTVVGASTPFHKPVISARNMAEAKYLARLLRRPNALMWVEGTQAAGFTAREQYAVTLGVDVDALKSSGDVYRKFWGTGANFLNRRGFRKFIRSYHEELERQIGIQEYARTPEQKRQKAICDLRQMRSELNAQRKQANKRRKTDEYFVRLNARIAEQSA